MLQLGGDEALMVAELESFAYRPLDFVYWAFPWGKIGTPLEHMVGPFPWQIKVLQDLQDEYARCLDTRERNQFVGAVLSEAYQIAIRSGHDVGKTALLAWIVWWALSTFQDCRGRGTANTEKQLRTILWPELAKWHQLFIGKELFKWTATSIYSTLPDHGANWSFTAVPWSEENPEAFAGLHNYYKRVIVVMDEASAIIDKVWEVTDGVMHEANTELIWVAPGNPTRNSGRFRECWGRFAGEWHVYQVDSRDVPTANREKINRAIKLWGEESDFVKVRYLGEFPEAATTQLFPLETIRLARKRPVPAGDWEPLVLSVDVARFGSNESVIGYRRGKNARSAGPLERYRGLTVPELGDKIVGHIAAHDPDAVFIDEGGVGGGVVDYVRMLGHDCIGVQFGGKPSMAVQGIRCANKRAEMFVSLLAAMRSGLAIADDDDLQDALIEIEYYHKKPNEEIILTAKEDMDVPDNICLDWADQLAMTYAFFVSPKLRAANVNTTKSEYDPYSSKMMEVG